MTGVQTCALPIYSLQQKHHEIIGSLLPLEKHEESKETCDRLFDSLRGIAQGVFLLGELSPASLDAIQSFGELWSTKILATKLASIGIATKWTDSREIIKTGTENGKTTVNIAQTYSHEEGQKQLQQVQEFLFALADFLNKQGGDDNSIEMLDIYKSTILSSIEDEQNRG